jgi:hypothetical protein
MKMSHGKAFFVICALAISLAVGVVPAAATPLEQWASTVIDFSSYYNLGIDVSYWAAYQALGAPNTFGYDDYPTAWAPLPENGSREYITLGYATPVYAAGAVIRETWGNGFVYQVDVLDLNNVLHTVWTGTDPSLPGAPVDFAVSWPRTAYLVKGLKIYVNTDHDPYAWEETDAVKLIGNTTRATGNTPTNMLLLTD